MMKVQRARLAFWAICTAVFGFDCPKRSLQFCSAACAVLSHPLRVRCLPPPGSLSGTFLVARTPITLPPSPFILLLFRIHTKL